ncbi:phosphomannomutase/phosphoglucomutase [Achromobacter aloeverae]|nr:phosphomannomutase/phosphoglucomutase [Achromobacter aloeverae]
MQSIWNPGQAGLAPAGAATARMPELPPAPCEPDAIRGQVPRDIDAAYAHGLGVVLGTRARRRGVRAIVVGKDARLASVELAAALQAGIRASGTHVIDIGMAATPLMYFATRLTETGAGVMVTGGHDEENQNGFKIMMSGEPLVGDDLRGLQDEVRAQRQADARVRAVEAAGARMHIAASPCYVARVTSDVRLARGVKVALDCNYDATAALAPSLLEALGCEVTELSSDSAEAYTRPRMAPSDPRRLAGLAANLRYSDNELGLLVDGDGDRLAVVTRSGAAISADRLLMLFARDVLARHAGAHVVYDVEGSRNLAREVRRLGGRPVMWRGGAAHIAGKMRECGAMLAGEMDGQFRFRDRWHGHDDALYAAARLLEIVAAHESPSALLDALPLECVTPALKLDLAGIEAPWLVDALRARGRFMGAREVIELDGLRVEYEDGFGLARVACGGNAVLLRFEADSGTALSRIQEDFRRQLLSVAPDLRLPF